MADGKPLIQRGEAGSVSAGARGFGSRAMTVNRAVTVVTQNCHATVTCRRYATPGVGNGVDMNCPNRE